MDKKELMLVDDSQLDAVTILTHSEKGLPYPDKVDGRLSKRKGEFYRRYRFNGTVFTCDDEGFYRDLKNGNVSQIKLYEYQELEGEETVNRIAYDSYGTFTKAVTRKKARLQLSLLEVDNFIANPAAFAKLEALENASIE